MPGPRVEHDKRTLAGIDRHPRRRDDADQPVIDRPRQRTSIEHEFSLKNQNVRRRARIVLDVIVAALSQYIEQQY